MPQSSDNRIPQAASSASDVAPTIASTVRTIVPPAGKKRQSVANLEKKAARGAQIGRAFV